MEDSGRIERWEEEREQHFDAARARRVARPAPPERNSAWERAGGLRCRVVKVEPLHVWYEIGGRLDVQGVDYFLRNWTQVG